MSTQELSKRLITRSGCMFDVRSGHANDESLLPELFAQVAPEDKAFWALTGHDDIIKIANVDHHPNKTFLAFVGAEEEVIAAATLDCDADLELGRVNLVIRSDFKHDGVSWELLAHVVRYAEAIGVKSLESVESRENQAAIELEREMGFAPLEHPTSPTLVLMQMKLGQT
jgi:GNAT superfamily N-acetyltransferase